MDRFLTRIINLCVLPGRAVGLLLLPLIVFVCMAVWAAQVGLNTFASWGAPVFMLGTGITVNTLLDLQWYCFALVVLFGGVLAFRHNAHVSVDFLSVLMPPQARAGIRIFGDLVFLAPFCGIITYYGIDFAVTSFASGEGSSYGGLMDRWVIKACVPLGFALLGIAAVARAGRTIVRLVQGTIAQDGDV